MIKSDFCQPFVIAFSFFNPVSIPTTCPVLAINLSLCMIASLYSSALLVILEVSNLDVIAVNSFSTILTISVTSPPVLSALDAMFCPKSINCLSNCFSLSITAKELVFDVLPTKLVSFTRSSVVPTIFILPLSLRADATVPKSIGVYFALSSIKVSKIALVSGK